MAMSAVMLRLLRGYIMKNVNNKAEDSAGSNSIYCDIYSVTKNLLALQRWHQRSQNSPASGRQLLAN